MIWTKYSNNECTVCIKQNHGGRPPKVRKHSGRPKAAVSIAVEDLINWDPSKRVTPEIDKAVSKIFHVKMKQSGSKDNLVTVDSGGPQPLTYAPITVARKQSSRTVRCRSKQNKELMVNYFW